MSSSLVFSVRKGEPSIVLPAGPTPHELKTLSEIDDQPALRFHISGIHIYRASPNMSGTDPSALIRDALAKALVFYYPLAGRLRELPGKKLAVQCTGEGAVFVEADADVRLDQLGDDIQPPFPCLDQLIHGIGTDFLTSPLLFFQLTRLSCGGFILAHHVNHTTIDAAGMVQFLKAVAELAAGATSPSVPPVWARERLMACDPPRITHDHPEYDTLPEEELPAGSPVVKSFFFGPKEFTALRQQLPPHIRAKHTRFELLTACLWRCRTAALGAPAGEEVRARFIINARHKCSPPLPAGFYGNAIAYPVARTTAGELRRRPLTYAVELVRAAKESITEGYLQSVADLMVLRGRPMYTTARTYKISDLTRLGFEEVDFGWGAAMYSGPAVGGGKVAARGGSNYIKYRNSKGEDGILVPVNLPAPAMERFEVEIERMVTNVKEEMCSTISAHILPMPPPVGYRLVADPERLIGKKKPPVVESSSQETQPQSPPTTRTS